MSFKGTSKESERNGKVIYALRVLGESYGCKVEIRMVPNGDYELNFNWADSNASDEKKIECVDKGIQIIESFGGVIQD